MNEFHESKQIVYRPYSVTKQDVLAQPVWRDRFGGPRTEKQFKGKWLKEGRQKFRNFPMQENVEMFWWSANRNKICQVVRESERFENRWLRGNIAHKCFWPNPNSQKAREE